MSVILIAQAAAIGHYAIVFIVIAAIVGIALVVAKAAGLAIPPWVVTILWIILAACVGIVAIKFLLSML